jgi:transcriptional regulator with XRE-family HTH domain
VESIKRIRLAKGLSLAEVAERTGQHRAAVARIERAGYDPRASTLRLMAKALGVPVCAFFEEKGHRHGKAR